jgi:hypothetical protein
MAAAIENGSWRNGYGAAYQLASAASRGGSALAYNHNISAGICGGVMAKISSAKASCGVIGDGIETAA